MSRGIYDMALHPWRCLSLCAGVGGLDLGIRLAESEARTVCYVEREAAAASIMVARMEDGWLHPAPIWSDLDTFDAGAWRGAVDCVVSGDPCQPNSVAGRGLGADDDRWLLDRVIDTFNASRARRLFRENVPGNADGQLGVLVPALEGLGCRVAVGLFSAKELGFAHGRERLFVMADRDGWGQLRGQKRHKQPPARQQASRGYDADRRHLDVGHAVGCCDDGFTSDAQRGSVERDAVDRSGVGIERLGDALCAGSLPAPHAGIHRREEGAGAWHAQSGGRGGSVPLLTPGPSDPCWPDLIARAPHLEPAVRRMAHGMAYKLDVVSPDEWFGRMRYELDRITEAALESAQSRGQGNLFGGGGLFDLREHGESPAASPRSREADRRRDPLPELPQGNRAGGRDVGARSGQGSDLSYLREDIPAEALASLDLVRRPGVPSGGRAQISVDPLEDRVDRLRACGNGVVPLVAAYAWRTLEARLAADAGSSELVVRTAA